MAAAGCLLSVEELTTFVVRYSKCIDINCGSTALNGPQFWIKALNYFGMVQDSRIEPCLNVNKGVKYPNN